MVYGFRTFDSRTIHVSDYMCAPWLRKSLDFTNFEIFSFAYSELMLLKCSRRKSSLWEGPHICCLTRFLFAVSQTISGSILIFNHVRLWKEKADKHHIGYVELN